MLKLILKTIPERKCAKMSQKKNTDSIPMTDTEYADYVKAKTPKSKLFKDCVKAFLIGGLICLIGQCLLNLYKHWGLSEDDAATALTITLVFLSALLTGLDIYPKIAKHAGAGTLVPVTGFANSVAAPALEAKTEGYVLGVGAKVFTIAGPVILFGIAASMLAGIIYWIF